MIFYKGTYEKIHLFYSKNNNFSRQHFIEYIRLDLDKELNSFKLSCTSNSKKDLLSLFNEIHKESFFHINFMADDFINNGKAIFDQYVCLQIEEHELLNNG